MAAEVAAISCDCSVLSMSSDGDDLDHRDGVTGVVDGMKYLEGTPRGDGHRWRPGVEEKLGFYVYVLVDPRVQDGEIFYCGKGTGTRCFAHVAEARKTLNDATKDYPKLDRIRAIEEAGNDVRIDVLRHGLTEHEAFLIESAVIDVIPNLTNAVLGHNSNRLRAADINALHGATPVQFDPDHKVILIRVARAYYPGIPTTSCSRSPVDSGRSLLSVGQSAVRKRPTTRWLFTRALFEPYTGSTGGEVPPILKQPKTQHGSPDGRSEANAIRSWNAATPSLT